MCQGIPELIVNKVVLKHRVKAVILIYSVMILSRNAIGLNIMFKKNDNIHFVIAHTMCSSTRLFLFLFSLYYLIFEWLGYCVCVCFNRLERTFNFNVVYNCVCLKWCLNVCLVWRFILHDSYRQRWVCRSCVCGRLHVQQWDKQVHVCVPSWIWWRQMWKRYLCAFDELFQRGAAETCS